ncbi:MAG: hypothetical protein J6I76_08920 [Oribacterium sp.]|nr:hypothetical protein [Oribacterium sp.]
MLRAELYKYMHLRINWLYVGVSILLSMVLAFGDQNLNNVQGIFKISLYNVPITLIISYIFCAINFGQEFKQLIISRELATGIGRRQLVYCKYAGYIIFAEVLNIVPVIINTMIGKFVFKYEGGLEGENIIQLVLYLLLSASMCTISFMIAFVAQEIGKNLMMSLLFYFVSIYVLNSKYAMTVAHFLPIGQMRLLLMQVPSRIEPIFVSVLIIVCSMAIIHRRFEPCELK